MDYNLLKVAYSATSTTTDTVTPLTNQSLSYDNLVSLIDGVTTGSGVSVLPQKYIGLTSDLGRDFYCKEARIYSTYATSSGYVKFFYKTRAGATWSGVTPTWDDSGYYTYPLEQYIIGGFQAFYGNASPTVTGTCYDIQLLNWDEVVEFGTDGQLPDTPLELPYVYFRPTSLAIYNNNPTNVYAVPRVFVDSTGYYEADRIVKLSADYDEVTNTSGTWVTIDDGIRIPEDYAWELGTSSGVSNVAGKIALNTGTTSGYWESPIIRIDDPQSIVLYAYGSQKSSNAKINYKWESVNELLQVRASDTMVKQNAVFDILAVTGRNLNTIYPAKRIVVETDGSTICWSQPSRSTYGYLYSGSWTPNPTPWGSLLSSGAWYKIKPGFRESDSQVRTTSVPVTGAASYTDYYIQIASRTSCSYWPVGSTQGYNAGSSLAYFHSHLDHRPIQIIIFVPGSSSLWWFFVVEVVQSGGYRLRYHWYLLNDWTVIRSYDGSYFPSTSTWYLSSDTTEHYWSACLATDTGGIWVLCCDAVYKHNLYVTSPTATFSLATKTYRDIIKTGNSSIRGFWAIGPTCVAFFEHSAASGGSLTKIMEFTAADGYNFIDIASADVDEDNNLWISDRGTGHIQRINYEDQAVDFDLFLPFSTAVVASPEGRYAFAYVHSDQNHSSQDTLYRIDRETATSYYVGSIEGIYSIYPTTTSMYGRVVAALDENGSYFQPISTDPVWGSSGSAIWQEYPNANMGLPKGRYKQFRVTLQRNTSSTTTPLLEKVRIPAPLLMDAIPHYDYRYVYIDTDIETGAAAGRYDINLLVFWPEV